MILKIEKNAFSLIEIAIVIGVLSIFSAVAIPAFNCVRRRAISTAAQETIRQIKEECETNYINGIDKFTSSNLDKYQITSSGSNSCSGGTVTLTPEDTSLYPTYLYKFEDSELSYNFKGQTGTSFVACNKLICGHGNSRKINLKRDFVVADTYKERGCSGYVLVEGPSWEQAQENALDLGGNLVTVNDSDENKFIEELSLENELGFLWIGLKLNNNTENWEWANGEDFSKSSFDNFSRSIGQGYGDGGFENYGAIVTKFNPHYEKWNYISGGWHDSYNLNPIVKDAKGIVEIPICNL